MNAILQSDILSIHKVCYNHFTVPGYNQYESYFAVHGNSVMPVNFLFQKKRGKSVSVSYMTDRILNS